MTDRPPVAGLCFDPDRLLDILTLTLMRQPDLTREAAAGLSMLRRRRVEIADPELSVAAAPDSASQLDALQAKQAAIAAQASADAEALARRVFGPPDAAALEACLRERLPDGACGRLAGLRTIEGGYSKQTSLFEWERADGSVEQYVLRRDARLQHIGSTVRDEFPLVLALHRQGFPVAEPVLLVVDDPAIPEPFMVMRRLPGRVTGGPLGAGTDRVLDPSPILAEVLARLHAIPPADLGVAGFSDRPFDRAALLADIGYWHDRYLAHREAASPTLDLAFDFLVAEAAAGLQHGAVVHGDCGFYNLLIDDGRLVAMLDWEMAHLGSAAWDLAYVKEAVEAFGSYDAFLDAYERHGGVRPSAAALAYYNLFVLVRGAVMCVTGVALFNRGEPVGLDLLDVNCTLYERFLLQMPGAIAAFRAATGVSE